MTLKLTTLDKFTGLAFAAQIVLAGGTAINGPIGDIPVHFDASGQANGWADRTELAVWITGMALLGLILGGGLSLAASRAAEAGDDRRQPEFLERLDGERNLANHHGDASALLETVAAKAREVRYPE